MATAQQQDAEVQAYRTATLNLQFEDVPFGTKGVTLLYVCDTSTGRLGPLMPASWRHQVFDLILVYPTPLCVPQENSSQPDLYGMAYKSR